MEYQVDYELEELVPIVAKLAESIQESTAVPSLMRRQIS